jgi:sec-independent protein translocase protein TatC
LHQVKSGITSVRTLSNARPYVVIGCFVFGMLLTPPDVISQTLLAIPTWILFEFGLLGAKLIKK